MHVGKLIFQGHLLIVQYLIGKGGNIKIQDINQCAPLHLACEKGYLPIVQYLIEKGANIEEKDKNQWTPLHFASFYGKTGVANFL